MIIRSGVVLKRKWGLDGGYLLLDISNFTLKWKMETPAYHQIEDAVGIEMELLQVGSEPVGMRCPFCYEDVMTRANYKNSKFTHIIALILGIFFWWLCCCIIPYVTKRWKNVEHYCPNCRQYLGMYSRRAVIF